MVFLLVFVLAIFAFLYYFRLEIDSPAVLADKKIEIKIDQGESTSEIAKSLFDNHLINSAWSFRLYLKFKNKSIKPGDYLFPGNLDVPEIATILSTGSNQVIKITIPEGWRKEQIAIYLQEKTKIATEEFMSYSDDLEGKLFPDTYNLSDEPTIDEVIKKMTDNFETRTAGLSLTKNQLVLASIIEREAADDSERADIAGVFANRVIKNMKLQADPTVQYQKDSDNFNANKTIDFKFWQKLATGDIKNITGYYTTYQNIGLPPGPICNPGLASIKAAVSPSSHDYYYFFHGSDGKLHLSKTESEHDRKKALYL